MCTLSWLPTGDGYHLFFNRDEKHTRQRARPPTVHHQDGAACLYPIDPDGGGTWIAVSERGLTVALLNYYPSERAAWHPPSPSGFGGTSPPPSQPRSRGQIIPLIIGATSAQAAIEQAATLPLSEYPPFMLASLAPRESLIVATWDGRVFQRTNPAPSVLSTSSFNTAAVVANRLQCFTRMQAAPDGTTPAALAACHASHVPERGPFSVCMHREDASTVSHSHIVVESSSIRFDYTDGAPCEQAPVESFSLKRI